MPQLDYFRMHYLGKIWVVGLICLVLIGIAKFYEKRKEKKFLAERKSKELERKQMLIDRKNSNKGVI